ncbi:Ff.00g096380.m01.CDS01 [Fusarium sp. VM40]|nr:Ff.00g096380.m01.CDS01 [Fusarium sp. VM40]
MTTPPSLFHALLRPSMLQILRSTGYHSTRPAVLDSLTDLAARYLSLLCQGTAEHAAHNQGDSADFTIADIRMALQDAGALMPERVPAEETWRGEEDLRGVEEFITWFAGQRMKEMMEVGSGDGETDATDYLNALKKKHSKTGEDAKYNGTILGRGHDTGEIQVEGGPETTITEWISNRASPQSSPTPGDEDQQPDREQVPQQQAPQQNGHASDDESGLSSVGDRLDLEDTMDLS